MAEMQHYDLDRRVREILLEERERILIPIFNSAGVRIAQVEGLQEGANVTLARSTTANKRFLGTIASSGGGGGGGHTIQDDNVNMAARANLSFQDGFVLTDDAGANQTEVDLDYGGAAELADVASVENAGASVKVPRADHVHAHEAAHIQHDTTWAAKGDLIIGTANDTAAVLSVGANGLMPMAASGEASGWKHTSPAMIAWALG